MRVTGFGDRNGCSPCHVVISTERAVIHPQQVGELVLNLYDHEAQALVGGYPGSDNRTSNKA